MSHVEPTSGLHPTDTAPGDQRLAGAEIAEGIKSYLVGLGLATLLTIMSFVISGATFVWGPSIPVALVVLAIAQMGVHLVFFLHITTGPDNVNNALALAFGVLIVLLVLTGSLWIMAHLNQNMASMENIMQMQLESGSKGRAVTARGVAAPTERAPVGVRVSGLIQALHCDVGMKVKAGQLCAKIDPRPYQIIVDQTKADLQAAKARLEKNKVDLALAKAAFERYEALAKRRTVSWKAIDKSRASFERAQTETSRGAAKVAELETALQTAETNLGYTNIVSPLDGTVVTRNVELGQTVTMNSEAPPLFVIAADPALIQINVSISGMDSGKVKLGDKATFTVEAYPNRKFNGTVTEIRPSPHIFERAATTDVVISAPNPDHLLKPGMAAKVRIVTE